MAYLILGSCLFNVGNISLAEENLKNSIDLFYDTDNQIQSSAAVNALGKLYFKTGELPKALDRFKESLAIRRSTGNMHLISLSLNNLGACSYKKGELDEALKYYNESNEVGKQLSILSVLAHPLNNIGEVYIEKGRFEKAINYLNQALAINISLGNPMNIYVNYISLGSVYRLQRKYDHSIKMFDKGMEVVKPIDNKFAISLLLIEYVFTYSDARKFNQAEKVIDELVSLREEIKLPNIDAYLEYARGYYLKAVNKHTEALVSFRKSRKMVQQLKMMDYYILIGLRIAETLTEIYQTTKDEELLLESESLLEYVTEAARKNNQRVVLIEALILKGKIKLVQKNIASAREIFSLADQKARAFGFYKATKAIDEVDMPVETQFTSGEQLKDQTKTRRELSELLTAGDIHRAMLENVFNLSIPWSSKESILFTCVDDLSLIRLTLSRWKENNKISIDEFNFLDQILIEKEMY
ncbi:MAG: tetratricopeptide repeat protein, partial [Candidatus Kariarchaeaceae archaeon]